MRTFADVFYRLRRIRQGLTAISTVGLLATGCTPLSPSISHNQEHGPITAQAAADDPGNHEKPDFASATASSANKAIARLPHDDLWARIRAGYRLPALDSPRVQQQEAWYGRNPKYIQRLSKRAQPYLYYIVEQVERRGMPLEIALLPAIESAFRPHARSRARAVGMWQFIRSTGRRYGLKINWWRDGRRDIIASTKGALDYLQKLHKDFNGNWHLALAAYNAGEHRVKRTIAYNRQRGLPTNYQSLKLKRETLNYVPKLIAIANIISDPAKYDIELAAIPNKPYFAIVEIGSQIDLGVLASKTGIPARELQKLNPSHKRWATDPNGPHYLLVPVDKTEAVQTALNDLPVHKRVVWYRHYVRQGQTLGYIARRYGVSVTAIRQANRIRGNMIRMGRSLLIPMSTRRIARYTTLRKWKRIKRKPLPPPKDRVAIVHRVQRGDTLWSIARKYRVYVGQLTRWNTLNRRGILQLGQRLTVWVLPSQAPAASISKNIPAS